MGSSECCTRSKVPSVIFLELPWYRYAVEGLCVSVNLGPLLDGLHGVPDKCATAFFRTGRKVGFVLTITGTLGSAMLVFPIHRSLIEVLELTDLQCQGGATVVVEQKQTADQIIKCGHVSHQFDRWILNEGIDAFPACYTIGAGFKDRGHVGGRNGA